jgi:uridine kinase
MNKFRPTKQNPLLIGVAGGSGSGKTTFATGLQKFLGAGLCAVLAQDNYYRDLSKMFDFDGARVNFDHPHAIELALLKSHLQALKHGEAVEVPMYDFTTHSRRPASLVFQPRPVIVVDGILIFSQPEIESCFDLKIFVDASEPLRFDRRLERDVRERGRTADGVHDQFVTQVKPMHDLFVEPSKFKADRIVSGEHPFDAVYLDIFSKLWFEDSNFDLAVT